MLIKVLNLKQDYIAVLENAYLNGAEKLMRMNKFLLVRNRPVTVSGSNMNFKLSITLEMNFRRCSFESLRSL